MAGDPLGRDLGEAGVGRDHGSPGRHGQRLSVGGLPRLHVGRHGDGDLLRVREPEVPHVADEVLLARAAADARVERPLLSDRAGGAPLVVVGRIDDAVVGEREQLLADRAEEPMRIPVLKVGAPRPAHQQRVTGEDPPAVGGHEGETAVGVPGRGADLERLGAEADRVAVGERQVDVRRAVDAGQGDRAPQLHLHEPGAGHVIGVQCVSSGQPQRQPQLADQRRVARVLLEHRIDQHRLARLLVGEQIGVRARDLVEELAKQHSAFILALFFQPGSSKLGSPVTTSQS